MTQAARQIAPLNKYVREALEDYFDQLDGHKTTNLYKMVLEEIENPLFKSVMKHAKNNQSIAATILGISRGTLRKKIKQYKLETN
jgi:Fis family transcriptional regulator, factor for inversion stimulation protein